MLLQKAMKQGRNVHSISHVMHAHKGCGHIVWVSCLLHFWLLIRAYLPIVLQQSLVELTSRGPTSISQLESELIIRAAFYLNLNFT